MSLAQLQGRFQARIVEGDGPLDDVPERAQRGLRVYAHAYRATLLACLRDTFAKTWAWLGDDGFEEAARAFVAASPSRSWTLSDYGDGFPAHLALSHPDDPEVEELAWLDLALRRAFDGEDAPPRDRERLAEVDWDQARLRLHPTLRVRAIQTNAPAIWSSMAEEAPPPPPERLPEAAALRVWRQDLTPTFRTVPRYEIAAIEAARAGEPFGLLCGRLEAELGEGAAEAAGAMLGGWISDGVLVAFD